MLHKELRAYRLYTILEKKLQFLADLSHWYVNINKLRIKGDDGPEEVKLTLNVFFHALLNAAIIMAPFVPFVTEFMY